MPSCAYRHEALFYRGLDEFVEALCPFIADGVEAGEPVVVVVSSEKIRRLTHALGRAADRVQFRDIALVGANPARIIPKLCTFVERHAAGPVRAVGEPIDARRSPQALVECQQHESLLNIAFDPDTPLLWLVCPYDLEALAPAVIDEAQRSHPTLVRCEHRVASQTYAVEGIASAALSLPLEDAPAWARAIVLEAPRREASQAAVRAAAAAAGLRDGRALELSLVVSEAIDAIDEDVPVQLATWVADGHVVCELRDPIPVTDPLIGRRQPPPRSHAANRCLWLANQLFDLVQVRSSPAGTVTRIHVRLPAIACACALLISS